jgi:ectoine hydroxylase-related dioxygenase (phytanoyl-CoA dioxygenase family)
VSPRNGSTEIWLGTHEDYNKRHHISPSLGWIKREVFAERAKVCPPYQPTINNGSVVIRDLRLWHAGMPNSTSEPRIMLGFIFSPSWFGSLMRMRFPARARELVRSWKSIDCLAEFCEEEFDYVDYRQELNLTQTPSDTASNYVPKHGAISAGPENYW